MAARYAMTVSKRDLQSLLRDEAEDARLEFYAQVVRVVPEIKKRVLVDVGATTSAEGVAFFACEVLEDGAEAGRRDWLLVSSEPWSYLETWIGDAIVKAYRRAVKGRKDEPVLKGIEAASSRRELE